MTEIRNIDHTGETWLQRNERINREMQAGFEEKWNQEHPPICPLCRAPMAEAKNISRLEHRKLYYDCSSCAVRVKIWKYYLPV